MAELLATPPFAEWIGRSIESIDIVDAATLRRLAATLDRDHEARLLPVLGHWLFHLPETPHAALGADGHPAKGGFLPLIAQPRRMWAGSRVSFLAPVAIGAPIVKRTTIIDISEKKGATGDMVFVTLRHLIVAGGEDAIVEDQDLVYLPITAPVPPKAVERPAATHRRTMRADEALLFRFSALTFNAHRIHYDLVYAVGVERYAALVVHGPLQAMLLINFAIDNGLTPARFAFRGRAPLYVKREFTLCQAGDELWIRDDQGNVTMTAGITQ
ncbi:acyl-CoA dehydrogenase [Sphingomonas sp. AR_OL41]|uniref:FAS1-like dehydratase domain-containing protein n=1 Tax=Sphingomonas sp. AR_OL41 TaxID=3042729 RepID=UPI00247FCFE0|nr:MaoC family dehydratase N-terminal domain-containing protein [Sphingomonas sp. AR_OL41]MDH7973267.1 acyl-CoA dehydrogenase [Sphingomonas sp. AR_OL41]